MAKSNGSVATLYVSSTSGGTYYKVANVTGCDDSDSAAEVDATDNDGGGRTETLVGDLTQTVALTMHYNPADTAQALIISQYAARGNIWLRDRPQGDGGGLPQSAGQYIITSLNRTKQHGTTAGLAVNLKLTGPLTLTVQ